MKIVAVVAVSAVVLASLAVAAEKSGPVPRGSKVFIAPMESGLDGFIAPEFIKKKLPLVIVTDEKDADYVLSGASMREDDKWYNIVFGGKDKNKGNVRLLDVKTKTMVWAGEAGRQVAIGSAHSSAVESARLLTESWSR